MLLKYCVHAAVITKYGKSIKNNSKNKHTKDSREKEGRSKTKGITNLFRL